MKYIFTCFIILLQLAIAIYAYHSLVVIKPLMSLLDAPSSGSKFSDVGKASMMQAYTCLDDSTANLRNSVKSLSDFDENQCLSLIRQTIKNFPIHLLQTRCESDYIEIDILYNTPKPFVLTYQLVKVDGSYVIKNVGNACELFKIVNPYLKHRKINNEI